MDVKSNTTILDLNLDVLNIIYCQLFYTKDAVNLAKAHPYLTDALVYHSRYRFRNIWIMPSEIQDLPFILNHCGTEVLSLRDTSCDRTATMMELAAKYCPKLQFIEMLVSGENLKIIEESLISLTKLHRITLNKKLKEIDSRKLFKIINELPMLISLKIDNQGWNFNHLALLNNLTELEINIMQMCDEEINILANVWKNLRVLHTEATADKIKTLSKYCFQLEYLSVWNFSDDDKVGIGHFQKLKQLKIISYDQENGFGLHFETLHGNYNKQLESVEFPCGHISKAKESKRLSKLQVLKSFACRNIEPRCVRYIARMPLEKVALHELRKNDILLLIRECKTIRWLHINKSNDLDKGFFNNLLFSLDANGVQSDNPFVLSLNGDKKYISYIKRELESNLKQNLLRVDFNKYTLLDFCY